MGYVLYLSGVMCANQNPVPFQDIAGAIHGSNMFNGTMKQLI